MDRIEIERTAYTILDVLSDCGGILAILISIFQGFIYVINYNHFDTFMASRLFKLKKEDDNQVDYKSYFDRSNFFTPSKCGNIRAYFMDCLPKRCVCCKRTRKELGI